ncbi:MerR family transcriptional regulator [Domibacillus tundrae]|uniref:MerR family transcriptional regulator n=3 Tax=Domibacillus TaxID=1433999 RepID=UPI000617B9B9|nr:MerR family transcriptional regulator [Domibacillus tundrae]
MDKSIYQGDKNLDNNQGKTEFTVKEVATLLNESPNVIRNWMKELREHIPLTKNESGYNVFSHEALEKMKSIKQMHRQQNYSIKQINHYFATGGESFQPLPEKGPDEMLAEELQKMREAIQFLREDAKKQQEFNQALVEKLDEQQTYIDSKLEARDRQLMQALKETQEAKKLMLQEKAEQAEKKKGFFSRFFK